MNCPHCTAELIDGKHEGVAIATCPDGHGSWVPRGGLAQISSSEDVPRTERERADALASAAGKGTSTMQIIMAEATIKCPSCSGTMEKIEYGFESDVVIDRCGGCGIWIDGGELVRIEAYAEADRRRAAM